MKPALLVIDVQKDFYSPRTTPSLDAAVKQINTTIALFREKRLPIFCIQQMNPEDNLVPGTPGFDTPDELALLPTDAHIHKHYENAFNKTPLLDELQALDVDTVIVTGFCAEYCVLSTYRGAKDVDLKSIILHDAIASGTPEHIPFVERISDVITLESLEGMLV